MKKLITFFVTTIIFLGSATLLNAQESDYKRVQVLPKETTIDHDYFAGGSVVEINGTVNGDLYAGASELFVNGTINGDVLAGAGTIHISGTVNGNVRAVGGEIIITGVVNRNVTLLGEVLEIGSQAKIGGNSVIAGSKVIIASTIPGDLSVAAGSLTLSNEVTGNVEARVQDLTLTSSAIVGGNLTYWSDNANIDESASISGQVTNHTLPEEFRVPAQEKVKGFLYGLKIFITTTSLLTTLVIGFIFLKLLPVHITNAMVILDKRPGRALYIGFIASLITLVVTIGLLISVVGIPLVLLVAPFVFIYFYVARILVMVFLGMKVLQFAQVKNRIYLAFIVGLVFYYLLVALPFVGGLLQFLLTCLSFGAALMIDKEAYTEARKKEII